MSKINIGTEIDLSDLLASRMLIQANSGGGKSAIARVLVEESYGKVPFIIFDDDGEYYTLKEKFGDIVIVGGQHADIPSSVKSVKLLPREIISNQLSVIIDLSDMKTPPRIQYVKLFLETMMELPNKYWVPYLVLLEEAHKFCGQQDMQESAAAVKDLMSRGRKRGYCGILITQRIAKLHKDAAAECNNKFVGRTFLDVDMDRAAKELGFSSSKDRLLLRDLTPGSFYAFGTSINPHHIHTVDIKRPQTKLIKAGTIIDIQPKKPTAKLLAALAKLNELPMEAEKELKTMAQLQGENARLKQELSKVQKQPKPADLSPSTQDSKQMHKLTAENTSLKTNLQKAGEIIKQQEAIIKNNNTFLKTINSRIDKVRSILGSPDTVTSSGPIKLDAQPFINGIEKVKQSAERLFTSAKPAAPVNGSEKAIGKCSREIIRFLAIYPDRQFTKAQVAIATGYSANSGGFKNALSELNTLGYIVRDGKLQVNSEAMTDIVNQIGEIEHREYDISTFKDNLGKCEREIYDVLLEHPNEEFTKEELSEKTATPYSPTSGGFKNSLSRLTTLEIIERHNGKIRLNRELLELMN